MYPKSITLPAHFVMLTSTILYNACTSRKGVPPYGGRALPPGNSMEKIAGILVIRATRYGARASTTIAIAAAPPETSLEADEQPAEGPVELAGYNRSRVGSPL